MVMIMAMMISRHAYVRESPGIFMCSGKKRIQRAKNPMGKMLVEF